MPKSKKFNKKQKRKSKKNLKSIKTKKKAKSKAIIRIVAMPFLKKYFFSNQIKVSENKLEKAN